MTKDLALLVGPEQPWQTTEEFLGAIDDNLKARLGLASLDNATKGRMLRASGPFVCGDYAASTSSAGAVEVCTSTLRALAFSLTGSTTLRTPFS